MQQTVIIADDAQFMRVMLKDLLEHSLAGDVSPGIPACSEREIHSIAGARTPATLGVRALN